MILYMQTQRVGLCYNSLDLQSGFLNYPSKSFPHPFFDFALGNFMFVFL